MSLMWQKESPERPVNSSNSSAVCLSWLCVSRQLGEETFNRAKLLNVGYTETLKDGEYDCFIFSDVDLIPMDDRNLYHCYDQPRHFAIAMDKFGFR